MTFKELHIIDPILKSLGEQGYDNPTPIQEQSIPILLRGKDLLGCAQTGTGKTAAFSIPILQQLFLARFKDNSHRQIKALIVTPTRELAIQIAENLTIYGKYTGLTNDVVFGGVKQGPQVKRLKAGVDVLVATPGRLLDLMNQGIISLKHVEYFVLDEADRMLDMGFIHDIKKLLAKLPRERQSLFFSATMSPEIVKLSQKILGQPERVTIEPKQTTAEKVEQKIYFVSKKNKINLLKQLLDTTIDDCVLVFSRTKHGANKIVKLLDREGIQAAAIHGNKSQSSRQKALKRFKEGELKVLVATDIASRGIDIDELAYVVNYDLPNVPESYVHRIGRTGRAGASGLAISFCMGEERAYLRDIQKLIGKSIEVVADHDFVGMEDVASEEVKQQSGNAPRNSNRGPKPNRTNKNKKRPPHWRRKKKPSSNTQ